MFTKIDTITIHSIDSFISTRIVKDTIIKNKIVRYYIDDENHKIEDKIVDVYTAPDGTVIATYMDTFVTGNTVLHWGAQSTGEILNMDICIISTDTLIRDTVEITNTIVHTITNDIVKEIAAKKKWRPLISTGVTVPTKYPIYSELYFGGGVMTPNHWVILAKYGVFHQSVELSLAIPLTK